MRTILIFVSLSIFWVSCRKPIKYSEIPDIKFLSIPIIDTIDDLENPIKRAVLTYYLIDGNGDIGFNDGDTLAPYDINGNYYHNLIIDMYKIIDGIAIKVDTPEIGTYFKFRTKYIEPVGQNKTLKCTFYINLDFDVPMNWDSVMFNFYMYDRALNKSNITTTGPVVL